MKEESGTKQDTNEAPEVTGLLTLEERIICTQMVAGEVPWSKRAQSLLLVDDGASFEIASEVTGLRATQVKFWVDSFRKHGIVIFPGSILTENETLPESLELTPNQSEKSLAESPGISETSKSTKGTKTEKDKGSKKKQTKDRKKKKGKGKKKGK